MDEFIRLFVIGLLVNESRDCKKKEMIDDCEETFALSILFSSIRELIVSSDCKSLPFNENITWEYDWLYNFISLLYWIKNIQVVRKNILCT